MLDHSPVYHVPTHLETREPFVFGRSLGEFAKLVVVGFVALKVGLWPEIPTPVRWPLAGLVLAFGIAWVLLRVQRYPLDSWLAIAFRFGASPRRRVWRATAAALCRNDEQASEVSGEPAGWLELEHIRVRWARPEA